MSTIALSSSTGLRHALRNLRRRPGFTAAAVLTLALGIGATTAIFAVMYGVLLKPLPYPHADELVSLRHTAPGLTRGLGLGANETVGSAESLYVTYREENRSFEHVGLWTTAEQTLTGSGEPRQVRILSLTDGTLQALGVRANLLLFRADARRRELAIRAALGAGRWRIAAALLRESVVLGALGGAVGLGLAYAGLQLLAGFAPPNLPRVEDIAAGPAVLAFGVAAALASSLAFGSIPAMKYAFGSDAPLGTGAHGADASRERNRTRNALIVVQVALALVLLVGAGLMIRTFQALTSVDAGFTEPEDIEVASIFIPFAAIPDAGRYTPVYREVLERIAALPGVTAAGFGGGVPLQGRGTRGAISVEGRSDAAGASAPTRRFLAVSPGYLSALGTRLLVGRGITRADIDSARNAVLVTENLARELWGGPQAAIGKRIRWDAREGTGPWHEIIGVTQDVHEDGLDQPPPPIVYTPLITEGTDLRGVTYAIRSGRAGTAAFADEVRQAVWASHPDIVVTMRTMQEIYARSFVRTSFMLVLLAIAGAMALVLSVVGIYGVVAYVVSQRSREVGIRLALGADPHAVKRMFVRHALAIAAVGLPAGLAGAAAFSRFLASQLFGVRPLDPATYVAVGAMLLAAVSLAAYIPARRAARLDPAATLRAE